MAFGGSEKPAIQLGNRALSRNLSDPPDADSVPAPSAVRPPDFSVPEPSPLPGPRKPYSPETEGPLQRLKGYSVFLIWSLIGISFWFLEAGIHSFVFQGGTFAKALLPVDANELWTRTAVCSLFIFIGIYGQVLIAKRKRAERALKKSEYFLKKIIDTSNEGFWFIDRETVTQDVNPAMCSVLGRAREEVLGRRVSEFLLDETNRRIFEDQIRIRKEGKDSSYELSFRHSKNGEVHCLVNATPYFDESGRQVGSFAMISDISDRKKMEKKLENTLASLEQIVEKKTSELRESQRFLRSLLGNLPGMAYRGLNDPGRTMEFVSEGSYKLTGYLPSELADRHEGAYLDRIHPNDRDRVLGEIQTALEKGRPFEFLYRIVTSTDEEKWVWEQGRSVGPGQGGREVIEGFVIDITDRVKAEQAQVRRIKLEEGLANFSNVLLKSGENEDPLCQALDHLLHAVEVERVFLFQNYRHPELGLCYRMTHEVHQEGIPSHIGEPVTSGCPYSIGFERWEKILSAGGTISGAVRFFPDTESELFRAFDILSMLVIPIHVSWGWYGFIGFDDSKTERSWDEEEINLLKTAAVTLANYIERKKAVDELRENEKRFHALAESAPVGIFQADEKGRILYVNDRFCRIAGLSREEILSTGFDSTIHPEDRERVLTTWFRAAVGDRLLQEEFRFRHDDGTTPVVLAQWVILRTDSGGVAGFLGTLTDVTERQRTLKALEQSEKLASVGTLAAGVAHEILNPLNNIGTIVQIMLMEEEVPVETRRDLEEILVQIRRSAKITNNLRIFAKPKPPELTQVFVHELFNKTSVLIERDLEKDNILIERDFDESLPPVTADEDVLAQVFLNLLNNARDAMVGVRGDRIWIKTERKGDGVQITFGDNGPGIPPEILDKIFDPFFSTKDPGKGTGLGLSVLYSNVEQHGGTVRVESELGKGTSFFIWLPLAH